jgi:hypothetical protein
MGILSLPYALKQGAVSREAGFQNGVFLTNQWNPLRKPIYTILKLPRASTMIGHSKKRDTRTLNYFDVTLTLKEGLEFPEFYGL